MNKSESIKELASALCKTQLLLENATKSADNPFFKSKYADLSEVLSCVKAAAMDKGLSFTQMPSYNDGVVSVETMIMHESGEWISSVCSSPAPKLDPQGIGIAITYLRRYSLSAVFGLAQEDDDGNSQQAKTPQADDKPWYNSFELQKDMMIAKIKSGENDAKGILKSLRANYKVSKEVASKIEELS